MFGGIQLVGVGLIPAAFLLLVFMNFNIIVERDRVVLIWSVYIFIQPWWGYSGRYSLLTTIFPVNEVNIPAVWNLPRFVFWYLVACVRICMEIRSLWSGITPEILWLKEAWGASRGRNESISLTSCFWSEKEIHTS